MTKAQDLIALIEKYVPAEEECCDEIDVTEEVRSIFYDKGGNVVLSSIAKF